MKRHHKMILDPRNGNWFVWVQRDGARRYFNLGRNKRKAETRLEQIETEVGAGLVTFVQVDPANADKTQGMSVEELAVRHLKYVKDRAADATFQLRKHYVSMFVEFVKQANVSEVTNEHVDDFYQWVRKHHSRSPNGGRHAVEEIKPLLKWGQEQGLCLNPITRWPKITHEPPETKEFSDEELALLFQHLPADLKDLVMFGILTGLRPQEVRGLTVGHIVRFDGKPTALKIEHHKTSRSSRAHKARSVPLSPLAAEIIDRHCLNRRPSQHVFLNDDGQPYITRTLRQRIKRWCGKAGIKPRPTYALRHVFGVKQGILKTNQAVIAGLMGHSNLKTTTRYMINVDAASCTAVVELDNHMSRLLAAANSKPKTAAATDGGTQNVAA